jgi:hypothetical protein
VRTQPAASPFTPATPSQLVTPQLNQHRLGCGCHCVWVNWFSAFTKASCTHGRAHRAPHSSACGLADCWMSLGTSHHHIDDGKDPPSPDFYPSHPCPSRPWVLSSWSPRDLHWLLQASEWLFSSVSYPGTSWSSCECHPYGCLGDLDSLPVLGVSMVRLHSAFAPLWASRLYLSGISRKQSQQDKHRCV